MGNSEASQALFIAARDGEEEKVRSALASGADVNAVGAKGKTALHFACRSGREACALLLIQAGAKIDIRDEEGVRPLERARTRGHKEMADRLEAAFLKVTGEKLEKRESPERTNPLAVLKK